MWTRTCVGFHEPVAKNTSNTTREPRCCSRSSGREKKWSLFAAKRTSAAVTRVVWSSRARVCRGADYTTSLTSFNRYSIRGKVKESPMSDSEATKIQCSRTRSSGVVWDTTMPNERFARMVSPQSLWTWVYKSPRVSELCSFHSRHSRWTHLAREALGLFVDIGFLDRRLCFSVKCLSFIS